jgi:hypothetical protein
MFQNAELARLQAQKNLLVLQSSVNRLKLAADCQRLCSPEHWAQEAGRAVRRHPFLIAALAAGAGVMVVRAWRNRGSAWAGIGGLGKLASLAFTVWKLARNARSGSEE